MKSYYSRMLPVLLISFSLLYSSCSLIGLGTGAIIDHLSPDMKIIDPIDYTTIEHSTKITVHLMDNSSMVGRFVNITEKHIVLARKSLINWKIHQIKLDDINSIEIGSKKHAARNRFLAGLVFDIAFIIWLSQQDLRFG